MLYFPSCSVVITGGGAPAPAAQSTPDSPLTALLKLVWPKGAEKKEIPDYWLNQDIQFSENASDQFGILQRKNGYNKSFLYYYRQD